MHNVCECLLSLFGHWEEIGEKFPLSLPVQELGATAPLPFPTGCSFVWQGSDSACQWTSRDRTGLGWQRLLVLAPANGYYPPDSGHWSIGGRDHFQPISCDWVTLEVDVKSLQNAIRKLPESCNDATLGFGHA